MMSEAVTAPPGELIRSSTAWTRRSSSAFFRASVSLDTGFSPRPRSWNGSPSTMTPLTSIIAIFDPFPAPASAITTVSISSSSAGTKSITMRVPEQPDSSARTPISHVVKCRIGFSIGSRRAAAAIVLNHR
jgi:hypothetical protein